MDSAEGFVQRLKQYYREIMELIGRAPEKCLMVGNAVDNAFQRTLACLNAERGGVIWLHRSV